ncbi:MAG: hypothetical protein CFE24_14040 [Flavobacterium sp. BFFFF2]|nr:MAG: hypothetical protein CFE24_14040 [Flavobacterium sp. BFFFF2]
MKKLTLLLLIIISVFISCKNEIVFKNNEKDIKKTEYYTTKAYQLMMNNYLILSEYCENENEKNGFIKSIKLRDGLLGKMLDAKISNKNAIRIERNDSIIVEYVAELNVFYEKANTYEKIKFKKINKNKIKLISYQFNIIN